MSALRPFIAALVLLASTAACDGSRLPLQPVAVLGVTGAGGTEGTAAVDDGSYLAKIDPVGGQWSVDRIGGEDVTRFKAWVHFTEGGFLNHGAGCAGGYPAFYRLDGSAITVTRREAIQVGKCAASTPAGRADAAASERRLAAFFDRLASWERTSEGSLVLVAKDGTRAALSRPVEPNPEIAGRWLIETIGGKALKTERRPAILSIGMGNIGGHADCNSFGAQFTIPAPGRIAVSGPVVGTAIGCAQEDQAEDDLMTKAISRATAFRRDGDRLVFTGGPGMVVRRPPPPDRRLAGDYRSCGNTLLGGYHDGPITLAIDGATMRDNAGCSATYAADGPNLRLTLSGSKQCSAKALPFVPGEPVAVGGAISTLAVTRPDAFAFRDDGQLVLRTHRGHLTMCRKDSPPIFGE